MNVTRMLLPLPAILALSCGQASGEAPAAGRGATTAKHAKERKDVVATVNGAPITQLDVRLRAKSEGHKDAREPAPNAQRLASVLETVIGEELAAQRAAELGLDADPKYQEGLRALEAQVEAYRRRQLSELFWERSVDKSVAPSDAEARQFFDANQKQIRAQVHVLQILKRGEGQIAEVRQKLDGGKSFEEVAASLFPNLRPGDTPWDLGWMSWHKIPDAWRKVVYELKPGDVSPVIQGPNERYWIIKVVERKEDPELSFDAVKAAILADLKRSKLEGAREKARKELREKARVQHVAPPTPEPRPPVED